MIETQGKKQRFILAGIDRPANPIDEDQSLDELSELLKTAGGEEAGRVVQKTDAADPKLYVGKGKAEELSDMVKTLGADGVICDDELTPAQLQNLSDLVDTKVIDRSLLILDIFTQRASTKEAQMQIELAQLQYRLTRLTGLGTELSRQGASVGLHTRGGGETKLEIDRRRIRSRISFLKGQLKEIAKDRNNERTGRRQSGIPIVALVGYTNAGKSTLFNRLTDSDVLEEDELFATLDTTVRRAQLPDKRKVLMVDTVGFIHKLPAGLIDAFRATLEEVCEADILLHVVDMSSPLAELQMKVTYQELIDLKAADKPIITVFNKKDLAAAAGREKGEDADKVIQLLPPIPYRPQKVLKTSAFDPDDLSAILAAVQTELEKRDTTMDLVLPFDQGALADSLHRQAVVVKEEYQEDGLHMEVRVPPALRKRVEPYLAKE